MRKTKMAVLGLAAAAALSTGLAGTASAAAPRTEAPAVARCMAYLIARSHYPGTETASTACQGAYWGDLQFCFDLLAKAGVPYYVYPYACAIAYAGD
ncbi:hypothetical protein [Amycolatopsis sp. NPDC021455]|uniref:hypothetical protein n=1 Tax=Amycolatopsis sp. NPDC021455 TaxID=3154901 RepID=UPI0033C9CECA